MFSTAFTAADWQAVWLTAKLAALVTVILLLIGTPIAWWLARTRSRAQPFLSALVALPIVLPPTVIGFYLLLFLGPLGPIGKAFDALGWARLPFSFPGLVVVSVIYSMPFVVQPLQQAFESIPKSMLEAASTLRAGAWNRFLTVAVPLARPGFVTAGVLGFAHTVGEFGVVLMMGGSIPGKTRVLSVAIYDHVEAYEYADANRLSVVMVVFAMAVLTTLYVVNRPRAEKQSRPS
jgi:molybdate transport system permease protein